MNNPNSPRNIAPGDVVALKSGSSSMTVVAVNDDTAMVLWCEYSTRDIHERAFPLVVLAHTS
jgi:uncharacterized protein YodC (DUF2158 family)